ncbi:hypothetical protein LINPERHAP1_LOCUS18689 [Linum perenne]
MGCSLASSVGTYGRSGTREFLQISDLRLQRLLLGPLVGRTRSLRRWSPPEFYQGPTEFGRRLISLGSRVQSAGFPSILTVLLSRTNGKLRLAALYEIMRAWAYLLSL